MKRFVKHFNYWANYGEDDIQIEDKINKYAEENNLKIITISCMYQNGIYVLFEKESEETE